MTKQFYSLIRKRIENICSHKDVYTNVHSSIIHSSQKLESTHECTSKNGVPTQWNTLKPQKKNQVLIHTAT